MSRAQFSGPGSARIAAGVLVLAAAGCGAAEPSAPTTPAAYRAMLERAGTQVDRALDGVRRARGLDDLLSRLQQAAPRIGEAHDRLAAVRPPEPAAPGHAGAVASLEELARATSAASGAVESGGICTSPAALAQIGRSPAAAHLRSAVAELGRNGFEAPGLAPDRRRTPSRTLPNATILEHRGSGRGVLIVRNGSRNDGVVKLVDGGKRLSIYVARESTATAGNIADGRYEVFFASGRGWDERRNSFSRRCGFTRFDDEIALRTRGLAYTRYTITLNKVTGGNAGTSDVDPREFPR